MNNKYNKRPVSTTMAANELDIFEDDDEDINPGPGSYYNPHVMSSFKQNKVPERL